MSQLEINALFEAALHARKRAYAPYSHFSVGAAVLGVTGAIYAGCNVENAAFPVGACAEANAIGACVMAGEIRITAALVLAASPQAVTPCGACRQRLREFCSDDTLIYAANMSGVIASFTLNALLPHSFGSDHLSPFKRNSLA